jgi:hypothetical protein
MADASADLDLEAELDQLHQLPLDAFVESRNALAARLQKAGDKAGAARVKALARPSVAAWAVNQLYWKAKDDFDALLAAGERLQREQAGAVASGKDLRETIAARREALGSLVRRGETLLEAAGHGATAGTMLKVSKTLEALATPATRPEGVRLGRLVRDLEPPGFDALAAMSAALPASPARPRPAAAPAHTTHAPASRNDEPAAHRRRDEVPRIEPRTKAEPAPAAEREREREAERDRRASALEEAQSALAAAEARLERARRQAREAAGKLSVAERRAEGARAELEEAARRLDRAKERAARTAEDEKTARAEAEARNAERDVAEADRDEANHALKEARKG